MVQYGDKITAEIVHGDNQIINPLIIDNKDSLMECHQLKFSGSIQIYITFLILFFSLITPHVSILSESSNRTN